MRAPKMGITDGQFEALPQGIRKSQMSQVPVDELHGMRRDAEEVASDYNILTQKQIAALNLVRVLKCFVIAVADLFTGTKIIGREL